MVNNTLFILIIFWGIWILIPIIVDGVLSFIYMATILIKDPKSRFPKKHHLDPEKLPTVSIIIPTFNEEENINECLNYLKIQTYPHEKMEIIVVDNGSEDKTATIVREHIEEVRQNGSSGILGVNNGNGPSTGLGAGKIRVNGASYEQNSFGGIITLITRYEKGKAKALNAGIKIAKGEIIINIDSRSFLDPEAVHNAVAKFVEHPEYGAATGNIEIDWRLIYEKDEKGKLILDENGFYKQKELNRRESFLGKSQFLEYLSSFRIGRHFQDLTDSIYTLSGAFSIFRRKVLLKSSLYSSRTVSEDTDLTLNLMGQNIRIGYVVDAKAYLRPVLTWEQLYAQRVRWHRGEIEVIGLHLDWYANLRRKFGRAFWHATLLMIDHTFGFPRLLWTFLLPLFFMFGYSMTLIFKAILLMWAFYIFMDFVNCLFCYLSVDKNTQNKIKDSFHYSLVTPLFRLAVFYFRFAAYLDVLKEPPKWSTPVNPVKSTKKYLGKAYERYDKMSQSKIFKTLNLPKVPKLDFGTKISEDDSYGLEARPKDLGHGIEKNGGYPAWKNAAITDGKKKLDGVFESDMLQSSNKPIYQTFSEKSEQKNGK